MCTDSCKCNDCKNGKPHTHDDVQEEDGVSAEEEFQMESHVPESIIKHDNSQAPKGSDFENGQESLSVVDNSCCTPKKPEYASIDAEENKEASQSKNEILTQRQEKSSNCQHSVDKTQEHVDESQIPHATQVALKSKKASSSNRKAQNTTSQMRKSSRLQQKKQVAFIKGDND